MTSFSNSVHDFRESIDRQPRLARHDHRGRLDLGTLRLTRQSAHAQVIDLQTSKEAATQVGALLLTASLSTAVNAVKDLTREELVECLVSPLREPSELRCAKAARSP